jgi:NADH-quinone oxidoreductase subunit A
MFYFHLNNSLFYEEYSSILTFLFIAILLAIIIILLSYFLAVQNPETEKLSSYECGFEPYEDARHTFDVKFYLIAILFIVFDIETMFLIP